MPAGLPTCARVQVQFRNPHGGLKQEWCGAWSDDDAVNWTPRMRVRGRCRAAAWRVAQGGMLADVLVAPCGRR